MKTIAILGLALTGCANPYLIGLTTTSSLTTSKSLADHTISEISGASCSTSRYLKGEQNYYCELERTPATTYNRTAF